MKKNATVILVILFLAMFTGLFGLAPLNVVNAAYTSIFEGYENWNDNGWTTYQSGSSTWSITANAKYSGTSGLSMYEAGYTYGVSKTYLTAIAGSVGSLSTMTLRFRWTSGSISSTFGNKNEIGILAGVSTGGIGVVGLITVNGTVRFVVGPGGSGFLNYIINTTSVTMGTWYLLTWRFMAAANGYFSFAVNQVTIYQSSTTDLSGSAVNAFVGPNSGGIGGELAHTFDYDDVYLDAGEGISISSLVIKNRECLDSTYDESTGTGWLLCEHQYYHFQMNGSYAGVGVPDNAVIYFTDVSGNSAGWYSIAATNESGTWVGITDTFVAVSGNTSFVYSNGLFVVDTWAFFKRNLVDTWYVDLFGWANTTSGADTDWVEAQTDYFNIYSAGGLEKMTTSGNAGRIAGGDYFNLYATNTSYAISEIYWRNLVHMKMHFAISVTNLEDTFYSPLRVYVGFEYYANGRWLFPTYGPMLEIILTARTDTAGDKYWKSFVIVRNRGNAVTTQSVYSYWIKTQDFTEYWVDIWFNKINASSLAGAEITSYFYSVSNTDFWTLFTGGSWGASFQNQSRLWSFMPLRDYYDDQTFARNIEMVKVFVKVENLGYTNENATISISRIDQLDYTFSPDRVGIDTPHFEEPRTPVVPLGGVFGVLAGLFAWLVSALSPVFAFIWSGLVYILDEAIYFMTGQRGVFGAFVSMVVTIIGYIVTFMVTLATYFVSFVTVIASLITAFFVYIFGSIWGIFNFMLFNPSFNILNTIATIFGIMFAWLAGTSYTNALGQTYDFTYLATMHFGSASGGVVIFIIAFILGFFLTILRCFTTMSLAPILEPIGIFWAFVQFIIMIIETLINIIHRIAQIIIQIVHALASIAPRPFGL